MVSSFARALRLSPTDAEIRLWSRLRRKQLEGFRFRRQQPIGEYIVDFFCPETRLIIEVDGEQHADESDTRMRWLEARGYRVIRFWNHDTLSNTDGVMAEILAFFASGALAIPPPGLPLKGGGIAIASGLPHS
jgi:very-short-patch-repair endonuclease